MKTEVPNEADALYAASKLITQPWFRGLVFLAERISDHAACDIEEANISITLEEIGDDRGDVVEYSRVTGDTYVSGFDATYSVYRKKLTEIEKHAQN